MEQPGHIAGNAIRTELLAKESHRELVTLYAAHGSMTRWKAPVSSNFFLTLFSIVERTFPDCDKWQGEYKEGVRHGKLTYYQIK